MPSTHFRWITLLFFFFWFFSRFSRILFLFLAWMVCSTGSTRHLNYFCPRYNVKVNRFYFLIKIMSCSWCLFYFLFFFFHSLGWVMRLAVGGGGGWTSQTVVNCEDIRLLDRKEHANWPLNQNDIFLSDCSVHCILFGAVLPGEEGREGGTMKCLCTM